MSNSLFHEIMESRGGRRVIPTGNPSSNAGYPTPRDPVRAIERATADITRFQTYLMNAIAMARMTVFAVGRDRTYRAQFRVPPAAPGPGNDTRDTGNDCAIGFVIDTMSVWGRNRGSRPTMGQLNLQVVNVINMDDQVVVDRQQYNLERQNHMLTHTLSTVAHDISGPPRYRQFDLGFHIHQVVVRLQPLAHHKGLATSSHIEPDLNGLQVIGDPDRLQQLLAILLRNAIIATPQGKIRFWAEKENPAADRIILTFTIKDTGRETKGPVETTGPGYIQHELGLCTHMVEAMNGDITTASKQGSGTTTKVNIPLNLSRPLQVQGFGQSKSSTQQAEDDRIRGMMGRFGGMH
ncbi:hypothetical protein F5144DRAFT_588742 [Chaetomium tenue]|uniref:Uncharacterized protein n=1 Tax=Chaetomium tenue TaxID=1854479 RepID=A0ACB7PM72_9PEZI|nr:hypothetical protein F5144DRAFT_588742 [Chaetomium globosum]